MTNDQPPSSDNLNGAGIEFREAFRYWLKLGLSYVYAAYGNVRAVAGALDGFKPVVVAIVVEAIMKIGRRALKRPAHFVIAAAAFIAIYLLHVPFPVIVLAAAPIGLVGARLAPEAFAADSTEKRNSDQTRTVIAIDDHAPPPPPAITAAVVGVILNLALVFGAAVIWPQGLAGGTNSFAVITSIAALVALYRFKADVLWVVIVGGLIGLARAWLSG